MILNIKEYVSQEKEKIKQSKIQKILVIIQVGDNAASNAYVKGKIKDCVDVGYKAQLIKLDPMEFRLLKKEINKIVDACATDVDGIIIQKPIINLTKAEEQEIANCVPESLDVDGLCSETWFNPCTPEGIMTYINHILPSNENFDNRLHDKVVTVIGQGELVGKPIIPMLQEQKANIMSFNSKAPIETVKMAAAQSDIVISAVGKYNTISADWNFKDSAIIMDAGIDYIDGKICGDCNKALYDNPNIWISSTPGGVGLLTRLTLLKHL